MKRVAFIQNRLQFGGRFQVAANMIAVLNKHGIIPDFFCFASRFTPEEAAQRYGIDIQFNIKTIGTNYKVPFEWNILLFNKVVGKYVADYDLVINHNNTSFLYQTDVPTISYVHYPRKDRMIRPEKSIHFPSGPKKRITDIAHDALKLAHNYYRKDKAILPNDFQVANSEFTKQALQQVYPTLKQEIPVLYPPVYTKPSSIEKKDSNLVVSLGRFSADKRQIEQIEIAVKLPNMQFILMGFINSQAYFDECRALIAKKNIKNVTLLGNASKNQLDETLSKASYFIHSLRNEPFGITAVQAIQARCLPLVHNSGGQKEVVPFEELRYNDVSEAVEKLEMLHQWPAQQKSQYLNKLVENTHQFEASNFAAKFDALIKPYL